MASEVWGPVLAWGFFSWERDPAVGQDATPHAGRQGNGIGESDQEQRRSQGRLQKCKTRHLPLKYQTGKSK